MLCNVHYHADRAENQSLYFSCKLSVNKIIWSDHSLDDDRTCTRYNTDGRHILSIGVIYDLNLKIKHQQKRCKKKQSILSHPALTVLMNNHFEGAKNKTHSTILFINNQFFETKKPLHCSHKVSSHIRLNVCYVAAIGCERHLCVCVIYGWMECIIVPYLYRGVKLNKLNKFYD